MELDLVILINNDSCNNKMEHDLSEYITLTRQTRYLPVDMNSLVEKI